MKKKQWRAPDGTQWIVDVEVPGSSNAIVLFRHAAGVSTRLDRYNWYINHGPEARSVTSHLSAAAVLDSLDEGALVRLYRRSMPVSRPSRLT